jgi:hypothetical protein
MEPIRMPSTKITDGDHPVDVRLNWFGVSRKDFHKIVFAAVAARANFVPHDPSNAAGTLSYIFGTRALRDVFCAKKGWEINRSGNIESVYHPDKGLKIVFQNATSACDPNKEPQAISEKGTGAAKAVELGQGSLFPETKEEKAKKSEASAALWYFFVRIDGAEVTAELSWPRSIDDRHFNGFNERIFILNPGEWADIDISEFGDDEAGDDYEIEVTRK